MIPLDEAMSISDHASKMIIDQHSKHHLSLNAKEVIAGNKQQQKPPRHIFQNCRHYKNPFLKLWAHTESWFVRNGLVSAAKCAQNNEPVSTIPLHACVLSGLIHARIHVQ